MIDAIGVHHDEDGLRRQQRAGFLRDVGQIFAHRSAQVGGVTETQMAFDFFAPTRVRERHA